MNQEANGYYVFDAGNTRLKIARFQEDELQHLESFDYSTWNQKKVNFTELKRFPSILASVLNKKETEKLIDFLSPNVVMTKQIPLPISLQMYASPTLGVDRIANAVATYSLMNTAFGLSIDIGTCVKLDLVDSKGNYYGGSISPGVRMRFKSLHEFTGALPHLSPGTAPVLGQSTQESIQSGVMNGLLHEINGFIDHYKQQYQHLTIFLTGGDANLFDKALKNSIFVNENLTLIGLYLILKHNA